MPNKIEDEALPMYTIKEPNGKDYLSVIDAGQIIRMQIHKYDHIHPVYFQFDKRAIPELIEKLKEYARE